MPLSDTAIKKAKASPKPVRSDWLCIAALNRARPVNRAVCPTSRGRVDQTGNCPPPPPVDTVRPTVPPAASRSPGEGR